jgi:hypothetical protein
MTQEEHNWKLYEASITKDEITRKLHGIINDPKYTDGFDGEVVFTLPSEKKPYFVNLKDLKD